MFGVHHSFRQSLIFFEISVANGHADGVDEGGNKGLN